MARMQPINTSCKFFSFINSRHLKFSKFFWGKNRKDVTVESETCTGTAIYNIQGNKLLREANKSLHVPTPNVKQKLYFSISIFSVETHLYSNFIPLCLFSLEITELS